MKLRRIASFLTTLALALTLIPAGALAVSFTDVSGDHWARADIEYVSEKGVMTGIGDGQFAPARKMTALEAIMAASRAAGLSLPTQAQIWARREREVKAILPNNVEGWAWKDVAVCLELGVLTPRELESLCDSGRLLGAITREEIMLYLVRAMQLEPLAQSLNSFHLEFADTGSITAGLHPYVYLLTNYGVIKGDEHNRFKPQGTLSRMEMAVALRRAMDVMNREGVVVDLPDYTDYDFQAGTITKVERVTGGTRLTLNSEISGTKTVTVPRDADVYAYNRAVDHTDLRTGQYARVRLDRREAVEAVYLGGTLTTVAGAVEADSLDREEITLVRAAGAAVTLKINRYTEVSAGDRTGDASIIDLDAGYDTAVCKVNELGQLVSLTLEGGTYRAEGLVSAVTAVTGGWQLELSDFTGRLRTFTVPASADISVDGNRKTTLNGSYRGYYAELSVLEGGEQVEEVELDTKSPYVQGAVKGVSTRTDPSTITITDSITDRTRTFEVTGGADVTYEGRDISLSSLKSGSFATLTLGGSKVWSIEAYPGSVKAEGVVTDIRYDTARGQTLFTVVDDEGESTVYRVDMNDQPDVYRNDRTCKVTDVQKGDSVVITIRYSQVTVIDAQAPEANVTGTITSLSFDSTTAGAVNVTMKVTLSGGGAQTYIFSGAAAITEDGRAAGTEALKVGAKVAMVVEDNKVVAIDVTRSGTSATELTGIIFYTEPAARRLTLQYTDGNGVTRTVVVDASDARILDQETGETLSLNKLSSGDSVEVRGRYDSDGAFRATIIIL